MSSTVLSMIFYGSVIIYFYLGLYVYSLDKHEKIHQVFLCFSVSLSIWAFSYSLLNHAKTLEGAYLSFMYSILGWGAFYSLFLHLILLFTGEGNSLKLKHTAAIYAPVPITFFLFILSGWRGQFREIIGKGKNSWSIINQDTLMYNWVKLYYILFIGMVFYILVRELKSPKDAQYRNEIRLVMATLILSSFLGLPNLFNLTERFGWNHLWFGPNQFFPVIVSIFVVLIRRERKNRSRIIELPKKGTFLNEKTHEKIFFYVSQAYIFGAFFSFGLEVLLNDKNILSTSILSIVLAILGITVLILHKSRIKTKIRDNMIFLIMSLTIPFITLYHIGSSASFALIVPMVFILVAVAFNDTRLLTSTAVFTVVTLIFLWIMNPEITSVFTEVEHLARILIFISVTFMAYLINRIYKKRLKQIESQIDHERFTSEMSVLLSKARNRNLKSNLDVFIDHSVKYLDADYGCIQIFSSKENTIRKIEGYGRYDLVGTMNSWFHAKEIDQLMKHLDEDILSIDEFVRDLENFRKDLDEKGIKVMITPLKESGKILGVMFIGSMRVKTWNEGYFNTFRVITNILSGMLYKIRNEDELYRMAYYDALTGLPNRILFDKIVGKIIRDAKEDEMVAMIFLDLDNFKNINDLLGHSVGDRFLIEITSRIQSKFEKKDYMSRFGGDEFLIVLPNVRTMEEISEYASMILEEIKTPIVIDEREIITGGSIGISIFKRDGDNAEDLIKNADLAMYLSKSRGKNTYTICSEEIKSEFIEEKELENALSGAMERNELILYYQPKVDAATEKIVGVEALIRWNHPTKGLLPPGVFLPIAERIGLLQKIDKWVFQKACTQNLTWQDKGHEKINMSINVTPISLMENNSNENLEDIFKKFRWDPNYIEIEVTENNMNLSMDSIKKRLGYLREIGMRISLDDFGTAYSSLSRLHELPIDKVKIDRQFILNLNQDVGGRNLYDGILYLSKSLGLKVTVEGVETKEQADYVRGMGCDEIQGYYYYKPMPSEEIENLLKRNTPVVVNL